MAQVETNKGTKANKHTLRDVDIPKNRETTKLQMYLTDKATLVLMQKRVERKFLDISYVLRNNT